MSGTSASCDEPAPLALPPPAATPRTRVQTRSPGAAVRTCHAADPIASATPNAVLEPKAGLSPRNVNTPSPAKKTSTSVSLTDAPLNTPESAAVLTSSEPEMDRRLALQRRLKESAEERVRERLIADESAAFAHAQDRFAAQVAAPSGRSAAARQAPLVSPRRRPAAATPSESPAREPTTRSATNATTPPRRALPGAARRTVDSTRTAAPTPPPLAASVSPLTSPSARSASISDDENAAGHVGSGASARPPSPSSGERRAGSVSVSVSTVDIADVTDPVSSEQSSMMSRRATPTVRATAAGAGATPRGTSTAAALRARLVAVSRPTTSTTPRTSTGNVSTPAPTPVSTTAAATTSENLSASEVKELRQALKDKERELAKLSREVEKANQASDKALKRAEELQGKLDAEKAAFAAHKKDAQVQRQELQRELRQAQTTSRTAEQAQEKLQRDLEKHKEKLAAAAAAAKSASAAPVSSRASSASTTPVMTPRTRGLAAAVDPILLQAKLSTAERESKSLKDRVHQLEEQAAAAAANAEAGHTQEVEALREQVKDRDALLQECERTIKELEAKNAELLAAAHAAAAPQRDSRSASADAPVPVAAEKSPDEASPLSSSLRSPRQVVTFELSAREATAQLQHELATTQAEVAAYKRMHEHAERRIEQLEAALSAVEDRAGAAEEEARQLRRARAPSTSSGEDGGAVLLLKEMVRTLKERVASVTEECREFQQRARERSEESATLQAALEQAEAERAAQARQTRDLQRRAAEAAETAKLDHTRLVTTQQELQDTKAELATATDALETRERTVCELRDQLASTEARVAAMEAEKADAESQRAAASSAAAEATKQQVEHYKKRVRQLSKKVAETERELAVLGEEYTRACTERDAARAELLSGPAAAAVGAAGVEEQASPATERRRGSVSRSLSDALHSANRAAAAASRRGEATPSGTAPAVVSALPRRDSDADAANVPPTHDRLESDVLSLYSKGSAVEQTDTSATAWSTADRTGGHPGKSGGLNSVLSTYLPAAYNSAAAREWLMQSGVLRPPTTDAPARARSPQATHALNAHFFDPTTTASAVPQQEVSGAPHEVPERAAHPTATSEQRARDFLLCGRSPSMQALYMSPSQPRDGRSAASPAHRLSPRSAAPSVSLSGVPRPHRDGSVSRLAATFSELPAPPRFTSAMELSDVVVAGAGGGPAGTPGSGFATAAAPPSGPELQFSSTAGRLLVSKRGRRLERPVFTGSASAHTTPQQQPQEEGVCCGALASMSHALYASHMAAAGLFHRKSTFRFTIRVVRSGGADRGSGDLLVGFADRYVPMESFGDKCNAVRYGGCYYLSLRDGALYCARQGICGGRYDGWAAAAPAASERRWRVAAQIESGELAVSHEDADLATVDVFGGDSTGGSGARRVPECVARPGDEVTCTLQMEERSISYAWNGVDCGVAFTGVSLSPSLYPCVELNTSGVIVELLHC